MNKKNSYLLEMANKYDSALFAEHDIVKFPQQYTGIMDIEVSALLCAYLSLGYESDSMYNCGIVDEYMKGSPALFVKSGRIFENIELLGDIYTLFHLNVFVSKLTDIYKDDDSIFCYKDSYIVDIFYSDTFIAKNMGYESAIKCFLLFNMWAYRDSDSCLSLSKVVKGNNLVIPIDNALYELALSYGITKENIADYNTAIKITNYFKTIFPGDPCKGFSFAGKMLAFEDPRSKLFFVFVDILNHIKKVQS